MDIKLIRHYVGALVVFAMLAALVGGSYSSIKGYYGFTDTYTGEEGGDNIADRIKNMGIIQSIDILMRGIYSVANPTGAADLLGGLMLAAFGAVGFIAGLVFLPLEILGVITGFYYIPPIVTVSISVLVLSYIGFILISAKIRGKI